jgi:hypothetical protein
MVLWWSNEPCGIWNVIAAIAIGALEIGILEESLVSF